MVRKKTDKQGVQITQQTSFIKDHVTRPTAKGKVKRAAAAAPIVKRMKQSFGFDLGDIEKICKGDREVIKNLGEASRQAEIQKSVLPMAVEAMKNTITATAEYNTALADIIGTSAGALKQIDTAVQNVGLTSQRYLNEQEEMGIQYRMNRASEAQRHTYAVNYANLKGYIDLHMKAVDGEIRQIEAANRPQLSQIEADKQYEIKIAQHLIQNGNMERTDLLPEKNYVSGATKHVGVMGKIRSALGF